MQNPKIGANGNLTALRQLNRLRNLCLHGLGGTDFVQERGKKKINVPGETKVCCRVLPNLPEKTRNNLKGGRKHAFGRARGRERD